MDGWRERRMREEGSEVNDTKSISGLGKLERNVPIIWEIKIILMDNKRLQGPALPPHPAEDALEKTGEGGLSAGGGAGYPYYEGLILCSGV